MRHLHVALILCLAVPAMAQSTPRHGLSAFDDLKYPPDFKHFEYVNPDAPKGGEVRTWAIDSFDSLNPFILRGVPASGVDAIYDSLMTGAADEPDSMYGLIAESAEVGPERRWVAFKLRPQARWHDGAPITAEDVVFTFNTLMEKGHPRYKVLFRDVEGVKAEGADRVRFSFKGEQTRDLPQLVAAMSILPKHWYANRPFDTTSLEPPLGSAAYKVGAVEPGRAITYRRVPDYWARDLAVNRGQNNFDAVTFEYFRDRDVAFEAFKGRAYDFREEFTARTWATAYDFPAVRQGHVKREVLPDLRPSGVQAWFFNMRRERFKDPRVREALNLGFDYEWTNKTIFHGAYKRMQSIFQGSELAATEAPSPAELKLLEPYKDKLPAKALSEPYRAPVTDGSGNPRENLRRAVRLFAEAGWTVKDNRLVNAKGEPFEIEFLMFEASFDRIIGPFIANLEKLGIKAQMRIVDVAQYKHRLDHYDFDVLTQRYVQPLTPGVEQRDYWGSKAGATPGSRNVAGIQDAAIDALIERVVDAKSRDDMTAAASALDRVVMWNHYLLGQWSKGEHTIAYWDRFGRPQVTAKYSMGFPGTWWFDKQKAAALDAAGAGQKQ
jgi:microcin C transport system substrate-binding protein